MGGILGAGRIMFGGDGGDGVNGRDGSAGDGLFGGGGGGGGGGGSVAGGDAQALGHAALPSQVEWQVAAQIWFIGLWSV